MSHVIVLAARSSRPPVLVSSGRQAASALPPTSAGRLRWYDLWYLDASGPIPLASTYLAHACAKARAAPRANHTSALILGRCTKRPDLAGHGSGWYAATVTRSKTQAALRRQLCGLRRTMPHYQLRMLPNHTLRCTGTGTAEA